MGYNVSGIILIAKENIDKTIKIEEKLGINKKKFAGEIVLEESLSYNFENKIAIGHSNKSSIIIDQENYISQDEEKLTILSEYYNFLIFMASDVTDTYFFTLISEGENIREFGYSEGENIVDEGEKLEIEGDVDFEEEGSEGLFEIIGNYSGIQIDGDDLFELKLNSYSIK